MGGSLLFFGSRLPIYAIGLNSRRYEVHGVAIVNAAILSFPDNRNPRLGSRLLLVGGDLCVSR